MNGSLFNHYTVYSHNKEEINPFVLTETKFQAFCCIFCGAQNTLVYKGQWQQFGQVLWLWNSSERWEPSSSLSENGPWHQMAWTIVSLKLLLIPPELSKTTFFLNQSLYNSFFWSIKSIFFLCCARMTLWKTLNLSHCHTCGASVVQQTESTTVARSVKPNTIIQCW